MDYTHSSENLYGSALNEIDTRLFSDPLMRQATVEIFLEQHPGLFDHLKNRMEAESAETSDRSSLSRRIGDVLLLELAISSVQRPHDFEKFKDSVTLRYTELSRSLGDIASLNAMIEPDETIQSLINQMESMDQPPDEDSGWMTLKPAPA